MSPTLLEATFAILLLLLAWQIGLLIAPYVIRFLLKNVPARGPRDDDFPRHDEKNITPPPAPPTANHDPHGHPIQ